MRNHVTALLSLLLLACGGGGSDGGDTSSDVVSSPDGSTEVSCVPVCMGLECGDDGCGGSCGECEEGSNCNGAGQCSTAAGCESDDDCGEGEVCHPGLGTCGDCIVHSDCGSYDRCEEGWCTVPAYCTGTPQCEAGKVCDLKTNLCGDCTSGSDCPSAHFCGGDARCHPTHPCSSDADCKDDGQVCDKSKGLCVNCLIESECEEWQYCYKGACITDDCWDGTNFCQDSQVLVCKQGGKGFVIAETCTAGQFCFDAACQDLICEPNSVWCEGTVRVQCDDLGGTILSEVDCADSDLNCVAGECTDLACEPSSLYCQDNFTTAQCAEDGQSFTPLPCGAAQYCDAGACYDQQCTPAMKVCNGQVAQQCDAKGSELTTINCAASDQGCVNGDCVDYACAPGEPFCLDSFTPAQCSADGYTYEETTCPEGNYCDAGFCFLWKCEPESLFCVGNVAHECAADGSTSEVVTDCAGSGEFCWEGGCVDCLPSCDGKECGDDGCGDVCGVCEGAQDTCQEGLCVCTPDCAGKVCGDDGCGGSCGDCTGPQDLCQAGQCVCQPFCDGLECGSDGCDGSCGSCNVGQFCIAGICPPEGKACDDGNATPWDGCQGNNTLGEFLLASSPSAQQSVRLSAHKDGGYLAAWVAEVDGINQVRLRRFLADGTPAAAELSAHPALSGQSNPSVVTLDNGGTVAVWDGYQIDGNSKGVQARLLDSVLLPMGSPINVNTTAAGDQDTATVAALPGGHFVVAWESGGDQDGSSTGIFARAYDDLGTPITGEFQVNTYTYAAQYGPSAAALGDGFVVAWNSVLQDGASGGVYAQRYGGNLTPAGDEILLNEVTANNQRDPIVAGSSDGFNAAWESNNQDGANWGIFMRPFGLDGTPEIGDQQVNVESAGEQRQAGLGCTAAGVCSVAWRHATETGYEVRLRSFDADGVGGSVVVANVAVLSEVERPAVARLKNGDIVVAWMGNGYGTGNRVVARRYQADGTPLYH